MCRVSLCLYLMRLHVLALPLLLSMAGCDGFQPQASRGNNGTAARVYNDRSIHDVIKNGGRDRLQRVQRLIDAGVDIDALNKYGETAAFLSAGWEGQYDITCMLLEAGADHTIYKSGSNMRLAHAVEYDKEKRQAIWSPQQARDHARLVRLLEDRGESFDEVRQDFRRWRNIVAGSEAQVAQLRDQEIALRKARERDTKAGMIRSRSVASERATGQLFHLIATLPEHAGDFASQLHELVNAGADLDATNRVGETPAMHAVRQRRQFGVALQLLQAGADPSVHRRDFRTGHQLRATLIHYVAAAERGSHTFTEEQREEYEALINWFASRGESIEQAREELPLAGQPLEDESELPFEPQ